MKQKRFQMSETILINIILALSGGAMDAYSYLCRGHVFANAQTGNILLFGVQLAENNASAALKYLWPILAFIVGIVLSDGIRVRIKNVKIHWRQVALFFEIGILSFVCFIPQSANSVANILTSLACGIQVETFRKSRGKAAATTMCIGNLRNGTYHVVQYIQTRQTEFLKHAGMYYSFIVAFGAGAVIEGKLIKMISEYALCFSVVLLAIACVLMFIQQKEENE